MSVRPEFSVHLLNEQGIAKATALGEVFSRCLDEVEAILPPGPSREKSLVITLLQDASFRAKRGMAVDPANQKMRRSAPSAAWPSTPANQK